MFDDILNVQISVAPHPVFRRKGSNIYSDLKLKLTDLLLGTVASVQTVWGIESVDIPAGTAPNQQVAIPRKGAPVLNKPGTRGQHIVVVGLQLPKHLSASQLALVKQMQREGL